VYGLVISYFHVFHPRMKASARPDLMSCNVLYNLGRMYITDNVSYDRETECSF